MRKPSGDLRRFQTTCGRLPAIAVGFKQLAGMFLQSPEVSNNLRETSGGLRRLRITLRGTNVEFSLPIFLKKEKNHPKRWFHY
ncbi:hypothetical protein ASG01_04115 [Chryseobacterium sp. Leaf180]|nr:hypothetical protein ASG01_04115 [Chryseobacterium sp. Leaf180]